MSLGMLYADINDAVKDECCEEFPAFTKEQGKELIKWTTTVISEFTKKGEEFVSAEFVDIRNGVVIISTGGIYYSPAPAPVPESLMLADR